MMKFLQAGTRPYYPQAGTGAKAKPLSPETHIKKWLSIPMHESIAPGFPA
jgi:hypothetical protein